MQMDTLEAVHVGDTTQWIRVRAADFANPVLLLIQQGPGLPMINEVRRFEKLLGLEKNFTVIYWDQRGCGRSLSGQRSHERITLDLMVNDTVSLLEVLRDRFDTKPYVAGFSLGATVGAYATATRPDLVEALVAVGTDIDGVAAGNSAYDFALGTARRRADKRAIRQLEAIGRPPHLDAKQFGTRVRWASNFGGVTTNETYGQMARNLVASLVRSSDYPPGEVLRTVRGVTHTQAALLAELATLDLVNALPRLDVPVVMVQGRLDQVAPGDAAERYANRLEAPSKELVWFECSAHTPHLEEPGRYRDLMMRVRNGLFANT
jgi:pimeloyl-ACP methyl ester carboxylesterase